VETRRSRLETLQHILAGMGSVLVAYSVVNIDSGFGAGYLAGLINRMSEGER